LVSFDFIMKQLMSGWGSLHPDKSPVKY